MSSFISRNGLAALFFLGLLTFAISSLVGSDGEDGVLMSAARDFTGEAEAEPKVKKSAEPVESEEVAAPAELAGPAEVEGEFYDDAALIDSAAGYDPSPNPETGENSDGDEVMILPEGSAGYAAGKAPRVGEVAANGDVVISISDDADDE